MSRIVGIDLGTTNSLVAYVDNGIPKVIPDADGRALLPSVVAFTPDGVVVGEAARRQLARNPRRTLYSIKRLMGRGYDDIKDEVERLPFAVVPSAEVVRIRVGDREVTPPEVSAHILRALKSRAEAFFGEAVDQAVITVPAYFNDAQRQATRDAGLIAGFDVKRIVNEPTAASLAYGLHRLAEGTIAVYDLGGGTFDISILRVKDGIFEVLSTNGNTHLGGDDFDRALVDWLLDDIRASHGVDLSHGRRGHAGAPARRRGRQVPAVVRGAHRAHHSRSRVSRTAATSARAEVEARIAPLVEATIGPCRMALRDAGLVADQIDEVVLVGGSTRVPLVRRRVQEVFGKTPQSRLNPDEVVALGAAVQAQILAGGITDMLLLDVTPLSLGIETLGGIVSVLIPRNTTIPTMAKEHFTTSVDGQTTVDLHVLQGERELARDNRSLARFDLAGIDPMPAGMPKIEVTFLIDANGILQVQARELRTDKAAAIEVRPTYGLTEDEVSRMVEDSYVFAEADVNARLLIEAQTEADTVMNHVRRALAQGADLVGADERGRIEAALGALAEARAGTDRDVIRDRTTALNRATEQLADLMMDKALKDTLASKRAEQILERE